MSSVLLALVLVVCSTSTQKCAEPPPLVVYAPAGTCQMMLAQSLARETKAHPDWVVREARCAPVA
jgi:hypothetical protein